MIINIDVFVLIFTLKFHSNNFKIVFKNKTIFFYLLICRHYENNQVILWFFPLTFIFQVHKLTFETGFLALVLVFV